MAMLLLESNCDVNVSDDHGATPIFYACKYYNILLFSKILSYIQEQSRQEYMGHTIFTFAAWIGNVDALRLLIYHNYDVNSKADNGHTALYIGCLYQNVDIVRALVLREDLDVNALYNGARLITGLCRRGVTDIIVELLMHVNINIDGCLDIAIRCGHMRVAEILMNK